MLDKKNRLSLPEIATEVFRIHWNCKKAQYSLSDVNDLEVLSGQLRLHAKEIKECCE